LNKADGALTKFYETKLQKYFDEAGGQIKLKEQSEVKFSPDFVNYLNNAFRLREALYGKGATPNFEYDVTLQPVKDAIVELSIDGNKIDSEGTRSGKFTFPARAGQETGVVLQLVSTASPQIPAANSSLNTNSSANVSTSNVNTATNANTIRNFAQTNDNNSAANTPLRFPGQWGVFRLIENGGALKKESGEYVLNLKVGNKNAIVTIRPTGGDIFNREIFRSVRAPQQILR
jgi:type VI protein secretion system component VasK